MNHNIEFQKVLLMDFPWVQDKQLSLTKFLGTESPQAGYYCYKDSQDELCSIVCGRYSEFCNLQKNLIYKKALTIPYCPLCPYVCRRSLEL